MDLRKSLRVLFTSSLVLAVSASVATAQSPAEQPKKSSALIYIPKTRVDLSRKKITRPAPGSKSEADQVRAGVITAPPVPADKLNAGRTFQRPVEMTAAQQEAAANHFAVVPKRTATGSTAQELGANREYAQKAPFITDRGPLLPVAAIQRALGPTQGSYATSSIAKATSVGTPAQEFVNPVPPVPMVPPASLQPISSPTRNELNSASINRKSAPDVAQNAARPLRVTHVITTKAEVAMPTVGNVPQALSIATIADAKPAPRAEAAAVVGDGVITPGKQIITTAGTLQELAQLSFDDERSSVTNAASVSTPLPTPVIQVPQPESLSITPPVIPVVPVPVINLPAVQPVTARPVEIPAVARPASIPSPTGAAKSPLPLMHPQSAAVEVHPADVLLSELEREVAEMQAARSQLRSSLEASDMQAREVAARTNVAQAAQLQTLVTQVITKVRADQTQVATSESSAKTRVVSAEDLPADFVTIGSRLYAKGMFEDAEVAFRTALDQAANSHDRAFASYLLATTLRRQSDWTEAGRYYREVATQSDEPELRDLARWQLKNLSARRSK